MITGGTGDDVFNGDGIVVTANRTEITDFEDAGDTVGDVLKLATEGSTLTTAAGSTPVFGHLLLQRPMLTLHSY